tara:strand:+ start:1724 stop:2893 length:1170 start_codon:yes stop_codon:yes gene_type:complete
MVFSKIMNNMKNILDDSKKQNNNSQNKKFIDNLINQGKLHKRNKQIKIKNFNEKKHIIENNTNVFSKGDKKINNLNENTSQVLQNLQQEYNTDLAAWGTGHKSFMDNYTRFMGLMKDCQKHCQDKYPAGESNRDNKINACKNGCSLEQPELMPAKDDDTYVDSNGSLQTLDCNISSTKCLDGYITGLGSNVATNEQINGCTSCGGGSGGPAIIRQSGSNRSRNIKSCVDIDKAYNNTGPNTTSLKSMCAEGRRKMKELDTTKFDFKTKYADLSTLNNKLDTTAKSFESESNRIEKIKKKIRTQLHKLNGYEGMKTMEGMETKNMVELLAEYSTIQAEIKQLSGRRNNNKTSEAQLEDVELKIKSERMQLYIWSGLAILTMLLVIQKVKQ